MVGAVHNGLRPEANGDSTAGDKPTRKSRSSRSSGKNTTESSDTVTNHRSSKKSESKRKSKESKDAVPSVMSRKLEKHAERRKKKEVERKELVTPEGTKDPVVEKVPERITAEDKLIRRFMGMLNPVPKRLYLVGIKVATKNANFMAIKEALEKIFCVDRKHYTALSYDDIADRYDCIVTDIGVANAKTRDDLKHAIVVKIWDESEFRSRIVQAWMVINDAVNHCRVKVVVDMCKQLRTLLLEGKYAEVGNALCSVAGPDLGGTNPPGSM